VSVLFSEGDVEEEREIATMISSKREKRALRGNQSVFRLDHGKRGNARYPHLDSFTRERESVGL